MGNDHLMGTGNRFVGGHDPCLQPLLVALGLEAAVVRSVTICIKAENVVEARAEVFVCRDAIERLETLRWHALQPATRQGLPAVDVSREQATLAERFECIVRLTRWRFRGERNSARHRFAHQARARARYRVGL